MGIDSRASKDDIVSAYRNLAKQYHPDRNIGSKEAEQKFKEIQEAYDYLIDQLKNQEDTIKVQFDIFSETTIEKIRGKDIQYFCELTLKEGFFGTVKEIKFNKPKLCYDCNGIGFKNINTCLHCNGNGKVKKVFQQPFNFELLCPLCQGSGKAYSDTCPTCKTRKYFGQEEISLSVKIPAGINEDQNLIIENQGEPSPDSIHGSLIVSIKFKKDDIFVKKNLDLHLDLFVLYSTLVLGGKIAVPTIENETIEIDIPAGTQTDTSLKIKNKGYFNLNNKNYRGDIVVRIKVNVPKENVNKEIFNLLKSNGY